eukprot:CAMPEP_0198661046 /NCGR_PEP_ID=MMETSP1467-20131203/39735_1 /TAXON_ID=1462469 /ORGANISM="unid. sp., Strain CCMP2135" /LENGTH=324 /DNA_ID=CAMNT_0044397465 /DNA_START=31 /DNA_END=1006 /DNA_ORIENTATION=+
MSSSESGNETQANATQADDAVEAERLPSTRKLPERLEKIMRAAANTFEKDTHNVESCFEDDTSSSENADETQANVTQADVIEADDEPPSKRARVTRFLGVSFLRQKKRVDSYAEEGEEDGEEDDDDDKFWDYNDDKFWSLEFWDRYGEILEEGMPFLHVDGIVHERNDKTKQVGHVKMCVYDCRGKRYGRGFDDSFLGDADYSAETMDVYTAFFANLGDPDKETKYRVKKIDNFAYQSADPTGLCIIQELHVDDPGLAVEAVRRLMLAIHNECWFDLVVYATDCPNAWAFEERGFKKKRGGHWDWLYAMPANETGFDRYHGYPW